VAPDEGQDKALSVRLPDPVARERARGSATLDGHPPAREVPGAIMSAGGGGDVCRIGPHAEVVRSGRRWLTTPSWGSVPIDGDMRALMFR